MCHINKLASDHVELNVEELVRSSKKSSAGQVVPISTSPDEEQPPQDQEETVSVTNTTSLDDWLPITESRDGSLWSSTLLLLSSGIGLQAFALPVAFVALGWYWGIITLSLLFVWQLYTTWLLVNLHESVPPGTRYSRYLFLSIAAFGVKLGKLVALFPVLYASSGTCILLIINGGNTTRLLYQTLCGDNCTTKPLSGVEWYLIFVVIVILVAQFCPNLNSTAKISIIGAITAVGYCTMLWILSVVKDRPNGISYHPRDAPPDKAGVFGVLSALGFIAFAFRGHNVVLEIQGTLPSNEKVGSKGPMKKGVTISYVLIAACFFPLAIAGYWSYGNKIVTTGGLLRSFMTFHGNSTPKSVKALIYLLVIINYISVFQVYAMVVFDNFERIYVTKKNKKCPRWVRSGIRVLVGGFMYFVSVAVPFLGSLSPIIGGMTTLPLTFVYPCFMWIAIKKPRRSSAMWWINLGLGCLGIVLSVLVVVAGIRTLVVQGLKANFFNP